MPPFFRDDILQILVHSSVKGILFKDVQCACFQMSHVFAEGSQLQKTRQPTMTVKIIVGSARISGNLEQGSSFLLICSEINV